MAKDQQKPPGADLVNLRHVDWQENRLTWQFMLDSYEGGNRYRNAVYGRDRKGLPVRNLVRHKREYPEPRENPGLLLGSAGSVVGYGGDAGPTDMLSSLLPGFMGADPHATAADDDYELRRSRTPCPGFVSECVEAHLAKIYDQEVERNGPLALSDPKSGWWADVDGAGTPIDDWMTETVAPLLMVYGFLDIMFDAPPVPEGEEVRTQADVLRLRLNRCVATYILPENMIWYRLDKKREYVECIVLEYVDPANWQPFDEKSGSQGGKEWIRKHIRLRHWTVEDSTLYDVDGEIVEKARPHAFGRVPIKRVFDRRKHRSPHVGKSRYEEIAEFQREFYNRDSELILSDTLQAHPLLQGPEDYINSDGTVPIGPGWLLPMKKNNTGGTVVYEGFSVVEFPKDGAQSLRQNKLDLTEAKDRCAYLTKPAGATGSGKGTVAQSGVSKSLDIETGNKVLTKVAKVLAKGEMSFAEFALMICLGRVPTDEELAEISVVYPSRFDLFDLDELTTGIADFQSLIGSAGELPIAETALLKLAIRKLLRNMTDGDYDALDLEIKTAVDAKAKLKSELREGLVLGQRGTGDDLDDKDRGGDDGAESDPSGESNATMVASSITSTY